MKNAAKYVGFIISKCLVIRRVINKFMDLFIMQQVPKKATTKKQKQHACPVGAKQNSGSPKLHTNRDREL